MTMGECRTCLKTPAKKNISDLQKGIKDDQRNYIDIMAFCLDIKVTEDCKITTRLCNMCYKKIVSFYEFKVLSLKNDAYLQSLDPLDQSEDHKLTVYEDENGIKHENILESDGIGSNVREYCNREIKIELDRLIVAKDEDRLGESEIVSNIKDEIVFEDRSFDSDEEPLSVVQQFKYENVEDDIQEQEEEITEQKEKKMFKCKGCPKMFASAGGRHRHYYTKHLGKKSKCDICNKEVVCLSVHKLRIHNPSGMRHSCATCERRFVSQAVLDLHVLSHTKDYQFECDICQKKFSCQGFLTKHMRQVHEKIKNHKCEHCPKAFFAKDKLQEHMRTHGKHQHREICDQCGMSVGNLKNHMLRHRPKDERRLVPCKACPKMFYSYSGMKKHYTTTHLGKKSKCEVCNKEVQCLSVHNKRMHAQDELRYPCLECGRRCVSRSVLAEHMLVHTRDFQHECAICQKKFRAQTFLARHVRQVHEKERSHKCELCPKAFFSKDKLQDHLRTHSNERPYTCSECGLSFKAERSLTNHLLTHSDVKKFHCQLCSMSFKVPGNLRSHMIIHTKEKRYPCAFCGVRFGRSDHRNRHELTAHKKLGQTVKQEDC